MSLDLYPLSNYLLSVKDAQPEEDPSVNARLQRLQRDYEEFGQRSTVEAVMLCHEHHHPHILLLQVANAFFKLPGDYLKPEMSDIEGIKAHLERRLAPVSTTSEEVETNGNGSSQSDEWQVKDLLSKWWRPNYESFMYPYVPAHISDPKEVKSIYLIQLPESKEISVPKNMKLLAIPLFELYDNSVRYGPLLAALPHLLSKIDFVYHG